MGDYTYGDSAHLHAATGVTSGYTASYDAAGDMTCRAPSSSTTCAGGSPTGQQLTWDAEGRLAAWQNAPTTPTTTASYLYDGEGNRVVQQVADTTAGTTTTTAYVGSLETVTSDGTTGSTTTTDYASAGSVLAESVNGTLSYLAKNYEGSVVEALDNSGTVTASQLYAPYGGVRYTSGALPTDYGYTGQRSDASTGLDDYGARSYDPTLGQFTSADTWLAGGLNRYGYVGGNPTTATDPTGHMTAAQAELAGGIGVSTGMDEMEVALTIAGVGLAASTLAQQQGGGGSVTSRSGDAANAAISAAIAANTYTVAGGSVYVTATGALVVTTGATSTSYAVGDAGWLYWNQQISITTAADGAWSTPRVRNWAATHDTTKTSSGDVTEAGTGTGGGKTGGGAGAVNPPAGGGSIAGGGGDGPPGGGDDDPCGCGGSGGGKPMTRVGDLRPIHTPATIGPRPDLESLSDEELLQSVFNPSNGEFLVINSRTGSLVQGNARAYELLRRAANPNSSITPDTEVPYDIHEAFNPPDLDLC